MDVPAYLALIAQGRYAEALAVHRDANPFALICGRVCPAFCEKRCRRGDIDEPIAIRQAKRFMADQLFDVPGFRPGWRPEKHVKVAVVGAGPCGLTAALRLAQRGYQVTVFERMPHPGGMMTYGIPAYRLPREALFAEIEHIWRAGVEFRPGLELGTDFTIKSLQTEGYKAIVLALGAHRSRNLGVKGEDKQGVYHAVQMLRDIAAGQFLTSTGKLVVVVGGGDTAMDAARSAWRLGALEVHVVYRRERDDMPSTLEEVEGAEEEGIRFHFLVTPVAVLGDHEVAGVRLQRQRLGDYDSSGRRSRSASPGPTSTCPATFSSRPSARSPGWRMRAWACTARPRSTWARPSSSTCPASSPPAMPWVGRVPVVQSVGHGNLVAQAVDNWITSGQLSEVYVKPLRHDIPQLFDLDEYADARRPVPAVLSPEERRTGGGRFDEVEMMMDEHAVQEECRAVSALRSGMAGAHR